MIDYIYSVVRFIPNLVTEDQVVIGFIAGKEEQWQARWAPQRAHAFNYSIDKALSQWLDSRFDGMSVVQLIKAHETSFTPFSVSFPQYLLADTLDDVIARLEPLLFITYPDTVIEYKQ